MTWPEYYIDLLPHIAAKSKDPDTRVGCVIVGPQENIISTGFNGFPRYIRDSQTENADRYERPVKYQWTVHAELNAILNASLNGISTYCATAYVSLPPCTECAKAIIQAGITKVVYDAEFAAEWAAKKQSKYLGDALADAMLHEAAVQVTPFWRNKEQ